MTAPSESDPASESASGATPEQGFERGSGGTPIVLPDDLPDFETSPSDWTERERRAVVYGLMEFYPTLGELFRAEIDRLGPHVSSSSPERTETERKPERETGAGTRTRGRDVTETEARRAGSA